MTVSAVPARPEEARRFCMPGAPVGGELADDTPSSRPPSGGPGRGRPARRARRVGLPIIPATTAAQVDGARQRTPGPRATYGG